MTANKNRTGMKNGFSRGMLFVSAREFVQNDSTCEKIIKKYR